MRLWSTKVEPLMVIMVLKASPRRRLGVQALDSALKKIAALGA
jgi:hypothetical protein